MNIHPNIKLSKRYCTQSFDSRQNLFGRSQNNSLIRDGLHQTCTMSMVKPSNTSTLKII